MENGAPVPTDGEYVNETWPEVERDHAAVITYLDAYIGELMDLLQTKGIEHNTITFFASDNGAHLEGGHDYLFFNSTGGLLGHKRSLYEGGVRSPVMVRWPGVIEAGTTSDYAWAFWDVMPTVADIIGVDAPDGIDGESVYSILKGEHQADKEYLAWTWRGTGVWDEDSFPSEWTLHQDENGLDYFRDETGRVVAPASTGTEPSGYALRSGEWKIVVPHCAEDQKPSTSDMVMVYHLPSDPFEKNNLNNTQDGQEQIANLVQLAIKNNVTCNCFQCG